MVENTLRSIVDCLTTGFYRWLSDNSVLVQFMTQVAAIGGVELCFGWHRLRTRRGAAANYFSFLFLDLAPYSHRKIPMSAVEAQRSSGRSEARNQRFATPRPDVVVRLSSLPSSGSLTSTFYHVYLLLESCQNRPIIWACYTFSRFVFVTRFPC